MDLNFLNGVYSVKSEALLNEDDFNTLKRLDKSLFLKYLKTKNYGFGSGYKTLDEVVTKELYNVKEELMKFLNTSEFNAFYIDNDLNNLKIVYKEFYLNKETSEFDSLGNITKEALVEFFKHQNLKLIPSYYHELFLKFIKINGSIGDKLELQEKLFYDFYKEKLKKAEYKSLSKYLEYKKLNFNLNLILKYKKENKNDLELQEKLFNQEIVSKDLLTSLYFSEGKQLEELLTANFSKEVGTSAMLFLNGIERESLLEAIKKYILDGLSIYKYDYETYSQILFYLIDKNRESIRLKEIYYAK